MKCDRCIALCCNYTLIYAHVGTYQGWGVIATTNGIVYQPPWTFRKSCYPRRLPIDTCLVSKKLYKSPLTNYCFGVAMGGLLLKLQNFKKVKLIFGHPVCNSHQMGDARFWCHLFIYVGLQLGYSDFLHDQNNCDLAGAHVTCIYCSLSMKINMHEKRHSVGE